MAQDEDKEQKRRLGLIPARIGSDFAHKLLVEIPLGEPEYATSVRSTGLSKSRTSLNTQSPHYEYGLKHGAPFPVKALPGATMNLTVHDLSRCDRDLLPHVKWMCRHPECSSKRFATKDELIRSHPENRKLRDEADRLGPVYGHAHVYLAVIELPGIAERKDEKTGKVLAEGQLPTTILLSEEE
jgi:hypothetical protein